MNSKGTAAALGRSSIPARARFDEAALLVDRSTNGGALDSRHCPSHNSGRMDAFSYLSVLLAVIIGLAVTQVLQGYRALALTRHQVRWYAPPLIWSALVLVLVTQHWWASFGLAQRSDWTFVQFGSTLLETALLYMMAALVLPDTRADGPTDLKAHYYREAPLFFGVGAAAILWNGVRELALYGELPERLNLGFQLLFLALSTAAIIIRRERFHEIMAGLMIILFAAYIALLFARL